jgi:hypothetical protein
VHTFERNRRSLVRSQPPGLVPGVVQLDSTSVMKAHKRLVVYPWDSFSRRCEGPGILHLETETKTLGPNSFSAGIKLPV